MKRNLGVCAAALLAALGLIACSSNSDDDEAKYDAPEVGSAAELPSSGATTVVSDEAKAKEVFTGAVSALTSGLKTTAASSRHKSRGTETYQDTLDWSDSTVSITGNASGSFTYPDSDDFFMTPGTYNFVSLNSLLVNGTLTGATLTDADNLTYTISGKFSEKYSLEFDEEFTVTQKATVADGEWPYDYSVFYDYSFDVAFGAAFAIKRSDGFGGKFVITFAKSLEDNDNEVDMESGEGADFELDTSFLEEATAKLQVYDDSGTLVLETEIPLSSIEALDPTTFTD
jgi:hypothetical protein